MKTIDLFIKMSPSFWVNVYLEVDGERHYLGYYRYYNNSDTDSDQLIDRYNERYWSIDELCNDDGFAFQEERNWDGMIISTFRLFENLGHSVKIYTTAY